MVVSVARGVHSFSCCLLFFFFFYVFFQAEDGIRDLVRSRGLGDVYKRQPVRRRPVVASESMGSETQGVAMSHDYEAIAIDRTDSVATITLSRPEALNAITPQMLEELLEELAVGPGRALMIGDTTHDLEMANNAGVSYVAVAYGAHPAAALAEQRPLALMQGLEELSEWLRTHA